MAGGPGQPDKEHAPVESKAAKAGKGKQDTKKEAEFVGVGWDMPQKGKIINGRYYTKHALERMAPDIPQVRAELELRATRCGFKNRALNLKNMFNPAMSLPLSLKT